MTHTTPHVSYPSSPKETQRTWVQTEKASHEAWARLTLRSPRAAALAHILVAQLDETTDAVAMSYTTLAKLAQMSIPTIKRALDDLKTDRWIEVVQLGAKGSVNAFRINSRVAWIKRRDQLHLAAFTARLIVDRDEQQHVDDTELRQLPTLRAGELQLPTGAGEDPPAQPSIEGIEPELPAIYTGRPSWPDASTTSATKPTFKLTWKQQYRP